jgi:hypothetical protein
MKKQDSQNSEKKALAFPPDQNDPLLITHSHPDSDGEIFEFADLSEKEQHFIRNNNFQHSTQCELITFFGIVRKRPDISTTDLCKISKLNRHKYYKICHKPEFLPILEELRRVRVEADTETAYSVMVKLMKHADPNVAFKCAKFVLENNGAKWGFGKKEENTGVLQIQIEDKRHDKPQYSDTDLQDV